MTWNSKDPSLRQRLLIGLLCVAVASAVRVMFFGALGRGIPFLLFYPAVTLAALFGGLAAGLLATALSSLLIFFWVLQGFVSPVESLTMAIYFLISLLISFICHSMRRAQTRATLAHEEAVVANEKLQRESVVREETQAALRKSEAMLNETGRMAKVGGWEIDLEKDTLKWTRAVYGIFEVEEGFQPTVETAISFYAPESRPLIQQAVERAIQTGEPYDIELELITAKNRSIWVQSIGHALLVAGKVKIVSGTIQDITARKRAEEAQHAAQQIITGIMNALPVRIFWKDKNLVYLGCNRAFARDAGFEGPKEIIEKDDFQMGWREQADRYRGDDRQVMESGYAKLLMEEPQATPDGKTTTLLTSKLPLRDSKGEIIGLLGTYLDITERKQAEERLRDTNEYLENLFNHANAPIIVWDADGKITRFNHAFEEISGLKAEQVLGRGHELLFPEDQREQSMSIVRRAGAGERFDLVEVPIRHTSGSQRIVLWNSAPIYDVGGNKQVATIAQGHDITVRKQAEEALVASEVRYRRLFEAARDGILILDAETGMVVDVNPFLVELLGFTHEAFLDKKVWELGFLKDVIANEAHFAELQAKDYIRYDDKALEASDGRRIEVEFVSNVYLVEGRRVIQCNIRDITERRQAQEALAIQSRIAGIFASDSGEEMFNKVLEVALGALQSSSGVFGFIDEDGALVVPTMLQNPSDIGPDSEKTARLPQGRLDDSSWFRAIREKRTILSNEDSSNIPAGHAGIPRHLSVPILSQGEVTGLLQVANKETDYTEADVRKLETIAMQVAFLLSARLKRYQAQVALRRLNAELEQRVHERTAALEATNKELEAFSYSVSHDLRSPLRAVDGYARILTEEHAARLDDEGRRVLGVISAEAQRMDSLISDLLAFSRMSRKALAASKIDMGAMAQAAFEQCAAQAEDRKIKFTLQPMPVAQGDPAMLRQVWANLLSNAVKYTRGRQPAEIVAGGREENGERVYFLKDNGAGFDMNYVGKLFGVFQRLHADAEFEGTGVGLALVQRIVHRHGGRVWAEGKVNEGATFFFTLPAEKPA